MHPGPWVTLMNWDTLRLCKKYDLFWGDALGCYLILDALGTLKKGNFGTHSGNSHNIIIIGVQLRPRFHAHPSNMHSPEGRRTVYYYLFYVRVVIFFGSTFCHFVRWSPSPPHVRCDETCQIDWKGFVRPPSLHYIIIIRVQHNYSALAKTKRYR